MAITCTMYGVLLPLRRVSLTSAKLSIFRLNANSVKYLNNKDIWNLQQSKLTATSELRLAA